ncbi:DASS family sodium-coupled anion symporter [Hydrogenimonas urashimensis]|uniref:DASS family sodium-coupled anion symporter n=1 Tax=Hydrogenimonas urashimensis TaxID=2740515 RepID=UPI0019160175|nr:DASS family sodium-coupled anion symporter [Hydrogenimonas urashimensis]
MFLCVKIWNLFGESILHSKTSVHRRKLKWNDKKLILWALTLLLGILLWFSPPPRGLTPEAWRLFAIFFTTIFSIIAGLMPILVASILAIAVTVLSGLLTPEQAYEGYSQGFILLIVVAFLVSQAVVKSGLGKRIALHIIARFGRSTLGLAYSMMATDLLIAPAFPSNTARSGVLFPIVQSLAHDSGSKVADGTRKRLGAYLMMNMMVSLSISSSLWFTAMAANPLGAQMAKKFGVDITFGNWLLAACVPALTAFALAPLVLMKIFPPEVKKTPSAPEQAKKALEKMGPVHRNEWITGVVFVAMVILWALSGLFPIDKTAVAFAGLGVLMVAHIFTMADMRHQGEALSTLIWFSALYTLSSYLDKFGFMGYVGGHIAHAVESFSWPLVYVILILVYVFIHYLFVSQTAQMLALYAIFLEVGVNAGVPAYLMAFMLLFATNFNAIITPQGSSANVLFVSSEYMTSKELYKNGFWMTLFNTALFMGLGTFWILLVF